MKQNNDFLPQRHNGYENLLVYQKAVCIHEVTVYFCSNYINVKCRTYDQMVQSARSIKENIAEGYVDGATSKKSEIHLTNVAKGCLHELLHDYQDYINMSDPQRDINRSNIKLHFTNGEAADKMKACCKMHNDVDYYKRACEAGNDEQLANLAITLLHQEDVMLTSYIEKLKQKFLTEGGISEEMYRARKQYLSEIERKTGNPRKT